MEKRIILAFTLSLIVLIAWSALGVKTQPIDTKEVIATTSGENKVVAIPSAPLVVQQAALPEASMFKFEGEKYEVTFNEALAAIKEVNFKDRINHLLILKYGFFLNDPSLVFQKESISDNEVSFKASDATRKVTKRFIFNSANPYKVELEVNIKNMSNLTLKADYPLVLGIVDFSANNKDAQYAGITISGADKVTHTNGHKELTFPDIKFASLRDRYFCIIAEPINKNQSVFIRKTNKSESEVILQPTQAILAPNQSVTEKYSIYLGPQEMQTIYKANSNWNVIINYGTFDFIAQLILQLLNFFYNLVHNWGWAIIMLSVAVYLILFPLTLKQMRSVKEMQAVQPKVEELRKLYKDNPQKLNAEVLKLYKEHKVNPLGGCLPLLLQMPIFFALYQALMRSVALRGAEFLWIKDLSQPDRLFNLPFTIPLLGKEFNILPVIMAIGMFVQQKISMPASTSGSAAEQQKIMVIIMPIMFGVIFYNMPSGLVLYWLINSMLMLAYQMRIMRTK